jgi:hypothetical protein
MDESAWAATTIDDPVAYVQEFIAVTSVLLGAILGLPPEQFYAHIQGVSRRKTVYSSLMTPFGRIGGYFGVVEANNRGELHIHLLLFGSLPTSVLQNCVAFAAVRKKVHEVLASYQKSEIAREWLLFDAIRDALKERARIGKSTYRFQKPVAPLLSQSSLVGYLADSAARLNDIIHSQSCRQMIHRHLFFSCSKGALGVTGCCYCQLLALNTGPCVIELREREKSEDAMQQQGYGLRLPRTQPPPAQQPCWEACEVPCQPAWKSRSPIDPPNRSLFYWDLTRRKEQALDSPCPEYDAFCEGSETAFSLDHQQIEWKDQIILSLETELDGCSMVDGGFFEWLRSLPFVELAALYKTASDSLVEKNGYVVSHSPVISYVTGSHNNAVPIGCSEQAKAAAFYLGPYFSKEKFSKEECLTVLDKAYQHTLDYPSRASDTGTDEHGVKHFLERTLNRLGLHMEVSDYQAIAALLGMPIEIRSDLFAYCNPKATCAYMEHKLFLLHGLTEKERRRSIGFESRDDVETETETVGQRGVLLDEESLGDESYKEDSSDETDSVSVAVPEDDQILSDHHRDFGYCKRYDLDEDSAVLVPLAQFYLFHGDGLRKLNLWEYVSLIQIVLKPKREEAPTSACGFGAPG